MRISSLPFLIRRALLPLFALASVSAWGGTLYVSTTGNDTTGDGSAGAPYGTIQAAINRAAESGDTVLLRGGVYVGLGNRDIDCMGKAITIRGELGARSTVLNCQLLGRGFAFANGETNATVIDGLTIINGDNPGGFSIGGGIACFSASPTIKNCVIVQNVARGIRFLDVLKEGKGGGIYCESASPIITDCVIMNNQAIGSVPLNPAENGRRGLGGGIYCETSSPQITGCTISNNAAYGGALESQIASTVAGAALGGGVCLVGCFPVITNCGIENNSAVGGDGTLAAGDGAGQGGGIYVQGSIGTMSGCSVNGNTASGEASDGGGVYNAGTISLVNCTISANRSRNGGGIFNGAGGLTLLNCTIAENEMSLLTGTGIRNQAGTIALKNTIISGHESGGNLSGVITSNGHNLSSDLSLNLIGSGDMVGVNPALAELNENGGLTRTQQILPGSPALDAGDNNGAPSTDQRGFHRPVDGDSNGSVIADIGAFEYSIPVPAAPVITLHPTNQKANKGQRVVFYVAAKGEGPLTYQWIKNDHALGNEKASSLSLTNLNSEDAGSYSCNVTNVGGTRSSTSGFLTVFDPRTSNNAEYAGTTLPPKMARNQSLLAGVSMKNASGLTWSNAQNYGLAVIEDPSNLFHGVTRIYIIDPAQTVASSSPAYAFNVSVKAPGALGTYTAKLRMVEEFVEFFGETAQITVQVADPPNAVRAWNLYE